MTIRCPKCGNDELEGALVCSKCGSRMFDVNGLSTASIKPTDSMSGKGGNMQIPKAPTPAIEAQISLHIVRTGQILPLIGRDEFTIGRVSEGQSILPDIDLTPFEAYSQGVSRLHATIKIKNDKVSVADLGSSNGTRINQTKLTPNKEYKLNHGDVISLGKFKIQALIRQDR